MYIFLMPRFVGQRIREGDVLHEREAGLPPIGTDRDFEWYHHLVLCVSHLRLEEGTLGARSIKVRIECAWSFTSTDMQMMRRSSEIHKSSEAFDIPGCLSTLAES
jgi:hypothetical protein